MPIVDDSIGSDMGAQLNQRFKNFTKTLSASSSLNGNRNAKANKKETKYAQQQQLDAASTTTVEVVVDDEPVIDSRSGQMTKNQLKKVQKQKKVFNC